MKFILTVFVFGVVLWSILVLLLWIFRDPLIYRFDKVNNVMTPPNGWEFSILEEGEFHPGVSERLWSPESVWTWRYGVDRPKQVLVLVGNVGRLNDGVFSSRPFWQGDYGVTVMAYPGASAAPGKPEQRDIIERAVRLAREIEEETGQRPGFYGISMGGAVATLTAAAYEPAFLVLEAPLGNIWAIARGMYPFLPPSLPDIDTWESLAVADEVKVPSLVMHGSKDRVVPVEQGRALAQALGARYVEMPDGGHNDLARWGARDHVKTFIEEVIEGGQPAVQGIP